MKIKTETILVFLLLITLFHSFGIAQPYKLRFDHLTTNDGLTNNSVSHILQDKKGFLWINTKNGLNRYDGRVFKYFNYIPGEINSLSDNEINFALEDSRGNLWIATQDGLNILNPVTEKINQFAYNHLLSSNELTALAEDKFGNIWIGTRKGLNRFDTNSNKITSFKTDPSDKKSLRSSNIKSICSDKNGNLWIGTVKGLYRFDFKSNSFQVFLNDSLSPNSIASNVISYIAEDRNGNLWIGTVNGLSKVIQSGDEINFENYFFDDGTETTKKLNRIRSFDDDRKGNLWIGTIGGGLILFDPATTHYSNYQYSENDLSSINDNEIFAVCVDNFDNVWIGSSKRGISKYSPTKSRFDLFKPEPFALKELPANDITAIYADNENRLWLGTNGNGILIYQLDENYYPFKLLFELKKEDKSGLSSNYITSIIKDRDGFYWIGTLAGGLIRFNEFTRKIEIFKTNRDDSLSLSNNYINTIYEDSKGDIWIGTSAGGVNKFNKQNNSFIRYMYDPAKVQKNLNSPEVTSICEDNNGNLLFGTTTGGLNLFNRNTKKFTHHTFSSENINGISSRKILCIYKDKKGRIWIGTYGGGLNLFSNNSFVHYGEKDGLSSNIIYSINEDDAGKLWLATNKGLSRFNPESKDVKNFDESDGLQGREFNARTVAKMPGSNAIYFGGTKGLNIYHHLTISGSTNLPAIVISDFKVFNQSVILGDDSPLKENVSFAKEINLSHNQDVISFSFASLDLTSPFKNQYAYKLEGFDKDWIYSGNQNEVTYTNLNPGDYIFKVKATNSDGIWNENATQIKLIIHPPFWRSWWATIFYVLVAAFGIYAIRKYEMSRIKLRNELKLKEFESQKLHEVDQIKSRFFANLSHEFRTPLMLIKGPVEQLRTQISDSDINSKLNMVSRNIQNLQTLIDQLLELSQLEASAIPVKAKKENIVTRLRGLAASFESIAKQRNIELSFTSELKSLDVWFDTDKLEKVINNLLSNAVKFTQKGGSISVFLNVTAIDEKEFAQIIVADTGIGIDENKIDKIFDRFYQVDDSPNKSFGGSGIGLALVKELVDLHKWNISVISKLNSGTEFTLRIPLYDYLDDSQKITESIVIRSNNDFDSENEPLSTSETEIERKEESSQQKNLKPSILIVEDSEDVKIYLKDLLRNDYNILEAENGIKGIETAAENSPDLIISDIMMPSMDGIEFCRRIKSNWETSHIPVILLTAKVSSESKIEGLETGADDYLIKPFESRELFVRIKNLLEQRKRLREKFSKEIKISADSITTNSADNEFITKAFDVIEKNMSNPDFTAEDLARELYVSLSQLRRKLIALTGESPGEFLRSFKLKRAAQLILEKKLSITQIAFEVGFHSPSHFTKAFQQQFNCLPSEFTDKTIH
jgi:ligand-binding sensor domain-containing protein/signal transduction histidine kinase/DNA-binding response OmpR family regulator